MGGGLWFMRHMPARWWREDIVAEVHEQPIVMTDVQEELRIHLWRRGLAWHSMNREAQETARREVLQTLVDDRLVRHYRLLDPPIDVQDATNGEFTAWRKQFETDPERDMRL
eukprot:gene12717-15544_t